MSLWICLAFACARPAPEAAPAAPDAESPEQIAARLAELVAVDQALRNRTPEGDSEAALQALFAEIEAADAANTAQLKAIVARHGWITISTYGAIASQDAWLLAQHADADPDFQREVLALMEALLPAGEVRAADYAYLFDRVAAAADAPQRFGTQGSCDERGWTPRPLEDPEGVDALRAGAGLPPLAAYRAQMDTICSGEDTEVITFDPGEGLDLEALRAAGYDPTTPVTLQTPDGPAPIDFETEAGFEALLSDCE